MYDFANSGYTTVVITAIFNAFFVGVVAGGADWATLLWTTVVAISYVIVMFVGCMRKVMSEFISAVAMQLKQEEPLTAWSKQL